MGAVLPQKGTHDKSIDVVPFAIFGKYSFGELLYSYTRECANANIESATKGTRPAFGNKVSHLKIQTDLSS